ncbi:hypothetical protein AOLI_G00179170 [Acnodon oligacanthus]
MQLPGMVNMVNILSMSQTMKMDTSLLGTTYVSGQLLPTQKNQAASRLHTLVMLEVACTHCPMDKAQNLLSMGCVHVAWVLGQPISIGMSFSCLVNGVKLEGLQHFQPLDQLSLWLLAVQ